MYRDYCTLGSTSSFLSLPFCQLGHTSLLTLALNSGVLWTLGNTDARTLGCTHIATIMGLSMGVALLMGVSKVQSTKGEVLAGGAAISSGLITYNAFKNPQWFAALRFSPLLLAAALTSYGIFYNDVGVMGGVAGGYLAVILAL